MYTKPLRLILQHTVRGQLSLEFLLLFAIFLVSLAVIASAVFNTKNSTQFALRSILAEKAASDIENAINEVCLLGNGNKQSVRITLLEEMNLSGSAKEAALSNKDGKYLINSPCVLSLEDLRIKTTILTIENKEKIVTVAISG